jgi:hypothetical protein
MGYKSTSVKSKWIKTKWLLTNVNVQKYIPKTLRFSRSNLKIMLSQFSTVYFNRAALILFA